MNETGPEQADARWRGIYTLGGAAALIMVVLPLSVYSAYAHDAVSQI